MDGNRRWATERGAFAVEGYKAGIDSALRLARLCIGAGVRYLTLFGLSSENFTARASAELEQIIWAVECGLESSVGQLNAAGAAVTFMGQTEELPERTRAAMERVTQSTAHNDALFVKVAINYSGRQEIVRAAEQLARAGAQNINEETFAAALYDGALPYPDLLIRTGCRGRTRISNFMLWQLAYSELYVSPTLWPAFGKADFDAALAEFDRSVRLFGG
jgi:undecaprenyl diphosphate synthase